MTFPLIALLASLGALGGFTSGLLGVGGGVVMFPLLLYAPSLLGFPKLDAKMVAAIVVAQVFFSALIAGTAHFRSGRVDRKLTLVAGITSAGGAFVGGIASQWVSDRFLMILFGVITLLVSAMMLMQAPSATQDDIPVDRIVFPMMPLSAFSILTGVFAGFLGSGNFIFPPLLIYVLKIPTRIAIGSSLFIALINTSAGFLGKLITGQIPLLLTLIAVLGAALGAVAGERVHGRLSIVVLRRIYSALVALIALRVWLTILGFDR
jgi:uncharacterized membrane protein YfcA